MHVDYFTNQMTASHHRVVHRVQNERKLQINVWFILFFWRLKIKSQKQPCGFKT